MKVIYAKSIIEKLDEIITEAEIINRKKIEKIILLNEEFQELKREIHSRAFMPATPAEKDVGHIRYNGVDCYHEDYQP